MGYDRFLAYPATLLPFADNPITSMHTYMHTYIHTRTYQPRRRGYRNRLLVRLGARPLTLTCPNFEDLHSEHGMVYAVITMSVSAIQVLLPPLPTP